MKKTNLNKLLTLFVCGIAVISTAFSGINLKSVSAEEQSNVVEYKLSEEIAKMNSIDAIRENVFSFYAAVYWCGPYVQWNYADLDGMADVGVVNYSQIQPNSAIAVVPSGASAGTNSCFSYTGSHSVGRAEQDSTVDRTWAIGWTAPKSGTVTIEETTLTVTNGFNANLSMGFSKGAETRQKIEPTDASLGWNLYEVGETYTIPCRFFL